MRDRYNIKGLVIDPYNELDHTREFESETEYVSQMLSKVKRFAQVCLLGLSVSICLEACVALLW